MQVTEEQAGDLAEVGLMADPEAFRNDDLAWSAEVLGGDAPPAFLLDPSPGRIHEQLASRWHGEKCS